MNKRKDIPADCPPLLREVIETAGGKTAAATAMGIYSADIAAILHRRAKFSPHRQQQARNALAKLKGEIPTMPRQPKISESCPPVVKALIEQEGGFLQAAKKAGVGKDGIRLLAVGERELSEAMKQKILAVLPPLASTAPFGASAAPPQRKEYPPWDSKTRSVKARGAGGKQIVIKKLPTPMADLLDKHHGNRSYAGRAAGYAAASPFTAVVEKISAYTPKMHARFMAALAGEPPPSEAATVHVLDKYITKLAICFANLSEYEAIEEIAEIFGAELVCRMPAAGNLWITIYRMSDRDKLEKFKRLARRDAKEIVCP